MRLYPEDDWDDLDEDSMRQARLEYEAYEFERFEFIPDRVQQARQEHELLLGEEASRDCCEM